MYSRFKALEGYNDKEQEEISSSRVLIVGLGATGSVIAENLARHGVNLILVDRDYLEPKDTYSSNIYTSNDCKKSLPKAEAAKNKLESYTEVEAYTKDFENVQNQEIDLIMDGTDNLTTRYQIHREAEKNDIPWVFTAAISQKGYSLFISGDFCFKCFMNNKSEAVGSCETEGIMRETAQIVASESSKKAIQYLAGEKPEKKLFIYPQCEKLEVQQKQDCDCDYTQEQNSQPISVCGENKYQINKERTSVDFEKTKQVVDTTQTNEYLLRGTYNDKEIVLFKDGRAIIKAEDSGHAQSIYNKITGKN